MQPEQSRQPQPEPISNSAPLPPQHGITPPSRPQANPVSPSSTASNDDLLGVQAILQDRGMASVWMNNLLQANPKIKYGLAALLVFIVGITILQGGAISDIFTRKVAGRELRELVVSTVNSHKVVYGYSIAAPSDVDCEGGLKNEYGATVGCTIHASRTIGGKIEGKINVIVRVRSTKTNSSPMQVDVRKA